MSEDDRAIARTLKRRQEERAGDEDRAARTAHEANTERTHRRRADKAAYLRDKLAEAERASGRRED
jgi:hypothetical protein